MKLLLILLLVAASAQAKPTKRSKVIDFEGDLIEGLNKRPLDSLSEIAEAKDKKSRPHLYRKRKGFRNETQETLRELRYSQ